MGRTRACAAHKAAQDALRRPKARKLATNDGLREEVESRLDNKHSPEQIANRLAADFPNDQAMRISHETIYHERISTA